MKSTLLLGIQTVKSIHNYNEILSIFRERISSYSLRGCKILYLSKSSTINIIFHSNTNRLKQFWNDTSNDLKIYTTLNGFMGILRLSTASYC